MTVLDDSRFESITLKTWGKFPENCYIFVRSGTRRILNPISASSIRESLVRVHMALFFQLHPRKRRRVPALSSTPSISVFLALRHPRWSSSAVKERMSGGKGEERRSFMFAKTLCRSRVRVFLQLLGAPGIQGYAAARYPVCSRTTAERVLRLLRGCKLVRSEGRVPG